LGRKLIPEGHKSETCDKKNVQDAKCKSATRRRKAIPEIAVTEFLARTDWQGKVVTVLSFTKHYAMKTYRGVDA
jgi:hypothetical protein